jgi:asparagine synthase (glutamine-hydrolysing)
MDRGLYLGFRRLAILDVSAEGNQPMGSADGRYTLIFNGEIYNFIELRSELERQGEVFRSHSDTEVLLYLYAKYGIQCLDKLNGMFAFGLYDKVERTLLLVRDRMGVKPLFYWREGNSFAFASELRVLRGLPGFPSSIDPEALGLYLRLGTVPEWTSIYKGVSKLPPGSWMLYNLDSGKIEGPVTYWNLPAVGEESGKREEEWVDEIEALLWDATRIRLRSDVPLGVFLSGGIDSGLVAAAAAKQLSGLTSLTIGFAGEAEDETVLALATARQLGLSAISRNVDLHEGLALLPKIMAHFDEPFSDTSALPTSLVCAEARKEFTVVLSGDAGDEVFGGYENHVRAWKWRAMDMLPLGLRQTMGSLLASILPDDSLPKRFFRRMGQPVGQFGLGGKLYPFQDWMDGCIKPELHLNPKLLVDLYNEHLPKWADASSIDLAQRTDLRVYMLEDILIKVDRMSMRNSLEVRSPFLDYRLVELGLRIPSHLRVKNGQNKYLLRRLADRHLPQSVCTAPKRGFGIPIQTWLRAESSAHILANTLAQSFNGHINPFIKGGAEQLWQMGQTNSALTSAVVQLLCYRWWCQSH